MSILPVFLLMCTPDYIHPSPQDLRGLKLSRFRIFHYFKKRTKPIYFDTDLQRQLLDPTGHTQRTVSPFQNIPLFFSFLFFLFNSTMPNHQPFNFTCPLLPLFNTWNGYNIKPSIQPSALLTMLQNTNKMNCGIYTIFDRNGYPPETQTVQKINHRPK